MIQYSSEGVSGDALSMECQQLMMNGVPRCKIFYQIGIQSTCWKALLQERANWPTALIKLEGLFSDQAFC